MTKITIEQLGVALDWLEEHPVDKHPEKLCFLPKHRRHLHKTICCRLPVWIVPKISHFIRVDHNQAKVINEFLGENLFTLSTMEKLLNKVTLVEPSEKSYKKILRLLKEIN